MEELSEYDNLITAMAALFYTNKRMTEIIPCIFQNWKEYAFESKARKIRTFLSNEKKKGTGAHDGRAQENNEGTDMNGMEN